jgi:hypothetical protein
VLLLLTGPTFAVPERLGSDDGPGIEKPPTQWTVRRRADMWRA